MCLILKYIYLKFRKFFFAKVQKEGESLGNLLNTLGHFKCILKFTLKKIIIFKESKRYLDILHIMCYWNKKWERVVLNGC